MSFDTSFKRMIFVLLGAVAAQRRCFRLCESFNTTELVVACKAGCAFHDRPQIAANDARLKEVAYLLERHCRDQFPKLEEARECYNSARRFEPMYNDCHCDVGFTTAPGACKFGCRYVSFLWNQKPWDTRDLSDLD